MATILVIDDDGQVRRMLRDLLERQGHTVIDAPDGAVGTRLFRDAPTDLIITDVLMPEKDGLEAILELRNEFPEVKILAVSGGGVPMDTTGCLVLAGDLGANRTLAKPLRKTALLQAVNELLLE